MPAQLQAGDLDRRITVQRSTRVPANPDFNEEIDVWSNLVTIWAKRADASAGEAYRAQEVGAQISCRFTVRYSNVTKTISPLDRIVFNDKVFNVTGVREPVNTRNKWIEIDCVARADKTI
jgi:SPP1 family predicted phage head-tail adaptor